MATLKRVVYIGVVISSLASLTRSLPTRQKSEKANSLHVIGLPVGQGDGTAIVCPEHNGKVILYDLGSTLVAWSAGQVKDWLSSQTINGDQSLLSRITAVIISHPHTDHYNYLPEVVDTSKSLSVFVGGYLSDYKHSGIPEWLEGANAHEFNNGEKCALEDCVAEGWTGHLCGESSPVNFDVLAANYGNDTNEKSVVLQVQYGRSTTLLVGDFEGTAQGKLIEEINSRDPGRLESIIYKISHHGASRLANKATWLTAVNAKWAFVSSAYPSEAYFHPRCVTFDRLLRAETLGTGQEHEVACGDSEGNVHNYLLEHLIYSTLPQANTVCIVHFVIESNVIDPQLEWMCTTADRKAEAQTVL